VGQVTALVLCAAILSLFVLILIVNGRLRRKLRAKRTAFLSINPMEALQHRELNIVLGLTVVCFLLIAVLTGLSAETSWGRAIAHWLAMDLLPRRLP
jgi:hypothetical protein